jgi:membrane fusion protein (multidrug efflux system)
MTDSAGATLSATAEAPSTPATRAPDHVPDTEAAPDTHAPTRRPRRDWKRLAIMLSVPLILLIGGAVFWLTSGKSVSTDNAYVQQDKISVSAEVGGLITEVAVRENQRVNPGDLLFRIDPRPYRIALEQANADMADAEAKVSTLTTTAESMASDIATALAALRYAESNLARERALMQRGFNTRARMDAAEAQLVEARGRVADARAAQVRAQAQLATGRSNPGVNPGILSAQAARDNALLQLARTEVRAPAAGIVSQVDRLHVGQMMVAGLPAVSIVSADRPWVEANFKETDLDRMRVGQRAELHFDAYPGLSVRGHVQSIGAGTGSEFSVLPAQNATGNWVKVTQRVPVRIAIDERPSRAMIAGLSAHVRIYFQ